MSRTPDVVIAGGGIAGSALAAVLARGNVEVAVLERDLEPLDRVRGEVMTPWGVIELRRLGLYDALVGAGGVFTNLTVPHDENLPGEKALPFALRFTDFVPEVPGSLCMGHPAMCRVLAAEAEAAGAVFLRGVTDMAVTAGAPPHISFSHGGRRIAWTPRLVVGADGRHSLVRRQLGFTVQADPPHNLLGGMLIEGVPDWPQDTQVSGTEGRTHFLVNARSPSASSPATGARPIRPRRTSGTRKEPGFRPPRSRRSSAACPPPSTTSGNRSSTRWRWR